MPSPIIPNALKPGDTIAFISPSARIVDVFPTVVSRATALLTNKGYQVRQFYTADTGIQNSIANRLSELRAAFTDPSISAIICIIGGPSFTELLPALLADTALHEAIRAHPKIVVGYSDIITGLHWFLHAVAGLRTFYGPGESIPRHRGREPIGDVDRARFFIPHVPMFLSPEKADEPNKLVPNADWTWIRRGKGEGRLFGGCLTVMVRLVGVRAITPDWRGRIVFFETATGDDDTSGNPIDRVQASIADLIAQGVFEGAAGLVVGRPFGYHTPERREQYINVIKGLLCDGPMAEKEFPILFNVDIGHTSPLVTLPFDTLASLDSDKNQFTILESAVV